MQDSNTKKYYKAIKPNNQQRHPENTDENGKDDAESKKLDTSIHFEGL